MTIYTIINNNNNNEEFQILAQGLQFSREIVQLFTSTAALYWFSTDPEMAKGLRWDLNFA